MVTIDDDFERFDEFETEIVLSPEEFRELNRFLETRSPSPVLEKYDGGPDRTPRR